MAIKNLHQNRQWTIIGVFGIAAIALLLKAVQLQLLSPVYRAKADAITIERDVLDPSRGVVYDRNGQLLVFNNAMYDLMVTYKQIDPAMDTTKFCRLLGITDSAFLANINKNWTSGMFSKSVPFPFMTMITPEVYARFQEHLNEFPGFFMKVRNVRGYPQHNAGQVLGYINEVNEKHIRDSVGIYESGDYIGATGLERYYESVLRGRKGVRFILKDNLGRFVGPWKEGKLDTAAIQGKDLVSTLDIKLQALGEKMLYGKIGSIVAIEPKTGEILAMVTSPTFDPTQMIISKQRGSFISALLKDSLKPMFDRSVSAEYPPGSIYKTMVALIGLQMGVWNKDMGMGCAGGFHYNNLTVKCHGHGPVGNMAAAIGHSCNNYFCTMYKKILDQYDTGGARRGLDSFNTYVQRFGLGKPLGVDFPGEKDGFMPTSQYYDKINKRDGFWYSTYIVSNGIGQGENQLTTMQMANLAAIIANKGYYITPHLIRGYRDDANGKYVRLNDKYAQTHNTGIDNTHFESVIKGMRYVIEQGTGSGARVDGVAVCGKTGTSQNPHGDDSSVFIGFAPEEDPKIAIAVYVENAKWGNDFGAPMTGLMIEQYLKGELSEARKATVDKMNRARLAYSSGRGYYVQKN